MKTRAALAVRSACCVLILSSLIHAAVPTNDPGKRQQAGLPVAFIPNVGQSSPDSQLVTHQPGVGIGFRKDGVRFTFAAAGQPSTLTLTFLGSNRGSSPIAEQQLSGTANYLRGKDPSRWRFNIPTYRRVRYESIYPGTDLLFYGNGAELEHDFIVSPGADPGQIVFRFAGAESSRITASGHLQIFTGRNRLTLRKPVAYQENAKGKTLVDARFRLEGAAISFEIGKYDKALPLVIDPILTFSTYLAGSGQEHGTDLVVDAAGNAYVAGVTTSPDFPVVAPYQGTCGSCGPYGADVFVTKLDPSGSSAIFSTFIGGTKSDTASGIAVDANGNVIVGVSTTSTDFPVTKSLSSPSGSNRTYGILVSLKPDGSALNYSTLVGDVDASGSYPLIATGDPIGNAYLTGLTTVTGFPLTPGTLGTSIPGYPQRSMFVTKLDLAGDVSFSTVIPGVLPYDPYAFNKNDFVPRALTVDGAGKVYIAGEAGPGLPTTPGTLEPNYPGDSSNASEHVGFVLKLNATASAVEYGTYVPKATTVSSMAVDGSGAAIIAGYTSAHDFTTTPGALQESFPQSTMSTSAGFVARLTPTASALERSTFLAGTISQDASYTSVTSVRLTPAGTVLAGGNTSSASFWLKNPIVSAISGPQSAGFVSELTSDLSQLIFSTYLTGQDGLYHTRVTRAFAAPNGTFYVTGHTDDSDFPTTAGSLQPDLSSSIGNNHAFVTKIDTSIPAPAVCVSRTSFQFGTKLINVAAPPQVMTVTNCGNATLSVSSVSSAGSDFVPTHNCGGGVSPGSTCEISVTFTPTTLDPQYHLLTIISNAQVAPANIWMSGEGGQPRVIFPSTPRQAGEQLVGTSGGKIAVFFRNIGDAELLISSAIVTGDFSIENGCTDPVIPNQTCYIYFQFSPTQAGQRLGTITVSSNAPGSPHVINLVGTGITTYPLPEITDVEAIRMGPTGTLKINGRNFFPASKVKWNGVDRPTTYVHAFQLNVSLTADDLSTMREFPVTVITPAPGGGVAEGMATVYKQLDQPTSDMIYDSVSKLLYVSVSDMASVNANKVLAIDPATGTITKTFDVGSDPRALALSDDGKFLYVGLRQTGSVAQLSLPSGTKNFEVSLGTNATYGKYLPAAIAVLPGSPQSYVVSLTYADWPFSGGLVVYDGQNPRPNRMTSDSPWADSLLFRGDGATLYASDLHTTSEYLSRFTIDANGISIKDSFSGIGGNSLTTDGSRLYVGNGRIIDPSTMQEVTTYLLDEFYTASAMLPDNARSRLYAANTYWPAPDLPLVISAADLTSIQTLDRFPIALPSPISHVARWGSNGLALRSGSQSALGPSDGQLIFLRTRLTGQSAAEPPDFDVTPATSSVTVVSGRSATYDLTLSSLGGFNGSVALTCSGAPQYATCSVTPASATISELATQQATVTVTTSQTVAVLAPAASKGFWAGAAFMGLLLLAPLTFARKRLRNAGLVLPLAVTVAALCLTVGGMVACGGGGGGTTPPNPPTTHKVAPGTYSLTVTATSGANSHNTTLTLVVQ